MVQTSKLNKLNKFALNIGIALVLAAVAGVNSSAIAQTGNGEGYQSNEKDATYGDAPAGLNPIDLMHRAQQLNGRSAAEFDAESQGQLDNSVSDYKRIQQQRILEQQKPTAKPEATPAAEPESSEI